MRNNVLSQVNRYTNTNFEHAITFRDTKFFHDRKIFIVIYDTNKIRLKK